MTTAPPPPPPPPPAPSSSATPWFKQPAIVGLLVVAAVAIPSYFLFFSGDDEPSAGSTSTSSSPATTTSGGVSTTVATTTTTATSTTTAVGSTTTTGATTTTVATTTSAGPQFDTTGPPTYGSVTLAAGFLPDPHEQAVTSGGIVDAAYLGGACRGTAAVAPDMELQWTGAGTAVLRFYFIADDPTGDTVLIINDPAGTWWCVDDSFDTSNPTIDFATGANGTYDIWLASYVNGELVPGTLYITEVSANHP